MLKKVTPPVSLVAGLFYVLAASANYLVGSFLLGLISPPNLLLAELVSGVGLFACSVLIVKFFGLIFTLKEGTKLGILKPVLSLVIILPIIVTHGVPIVQISVNFFAIYFAVRYFLVESSDTLQ